MDPGYSGHRPRVQLFQGDADATISYKNFGEGIKEWTDVLGLPTSPTSMSSGITLGTHQATRQEWNDSCGYLVLDAFTSLGGDHGPSDALFKAQYVIPFLGLDKTGAVDPEIAQCGNGSGGSGGMGGAGGAGASGSGGGGASSGGNAGVAGSDGTGGASNGTGGSGGQGGALNAAGAASGGHAGMGALGGGAGNGGLLSNGGQAGSMSNGGSNAIMAGGAAAGDATDSGCSCTFAGVERSSGGKATALITAFALLILRRRRKA
jgi:hypothetical protein